MCYITDNTIFFNLLIFGTGLAILILLLIQFVTTSTYWPCPDNTYILTRLLCVLFQLCHKPVLLKLHWTDVIQWWMQSSVVVVVKPINHFIHCLTPCFIPHSIQSTYLQRSPEAFNGGVDAPMSIHCCSVNEQVLRPDLALIGIISFLITHWIIYYNHAPPHCNTIFSQILKLNRPEYSGETVN